jgi:hypothetical protein
MKALQTFCFNRGGGANDLIILKNPAKPLKVCIISGVCRE